MRPCFTASLCVDIAVWVTHGEVRIYVSVQGQWHYLYRAVDKAGKTIDFLLSPTRDELTARRFLQSAVLHYGALESRHGRRLLR